MGRAVLRLVEERPAAVAARLQALPAAVERRGPGHAAELAAQAIDALGAGRKRGRTVLEDNGQVRRVRGACEHGQRSRTRLSVTVCREQGAQRLAQLERPLEVAAREIRPR